MLTASLLVPLLSGLLIPTSLAAEDTDPSETTEDPYDAWSIPELEFQGHWRDQEPLQKNLLDQGAYTLGARGLRISPNRVDVGIFGNMQVGTDLFLDVFEIYNARAKVTAIQRERFDVSFQAGWMEANLSLQTGDAHLANVRIIPLEWRASAIVLPRFSLHGGQVFYLTEVSGDFQINRLLKELAKVFGGDLSDDVGDFIGDTDLGSLYGGAQLNVSQVNLVAEFRLNRRDSILLAGSALTRATGRVETGTDVNTKGVNELEELTVGASAQFRADLGDAYSAVYTAAWQFSWEHLHLRVGWGFGESDAATYWAVATRAMNVYWVF